MRDIILKVLREEISKGKVTCDNCGWSWKLSEGGYDPYICHQCNYNNKPKNLQEQTLEDSFRLNPSKFRIMKKYWDENGVTKETIDTMQNSLLRPKELMLFYLIVYFGGLVGFQKEIEKRIGKKVIRCSDRKNNLRFKVDSVVVDLETLSELGAVKLMITVDKNGSSRVYNYEDGVVENFEYSKLEDLYGSDMYEEIMNQLTEKIGDCLTILNMGDYVDVDVWDIFLGEL
jgi:hypothetical protein